MKRSFYEEVRSAVRALEDAAVALRAADCADNLERFKKSVWQGQCDVVLTQMALAKLLHRVDATLVAEARHEEEREG